MAFRVASRGPSPRSSHRSTFSTTTIASSTTIPIASTRPKSEMLFRLKPSTAITEKVPTMATGTAVRGIRTARQFCRNTSTTIATRTTASSNVLTTSATDSRMNGVVS